MGLHEGRMRVKVTFANGESKIFIKTATRSDYELDGEMYEKQENGDDGFLKNVEKSVKKKSFEDSPIISEESAGY